MRQKIFAVLTITALLLGSAIVAKTAVSTIAGLAVAQSSTVWNSVKDAAVGDNLTNGLLASALYFFDGTDFDRARGSTTFGLLVDIARMPTSGTGTYAIKSENLTTASQNFAFGFTSKKIAIRSPLTNTDEICINFLGGTAVCPAANTAGNSRMQPGGSIILDDFAVTSLSFIAASGTQTVFVNAWN